MKEKEKQCLQPLLKREPFEAQGEIQNAMDVML